MKRKYKRRQIVEEIAKEIQGIMKKYPPGYRVIIFHKDLRFDTLIRVGRGKHNE